MAWSLSINLDKAEYVKMESVLLQLYNYHTKLQERSRSGKQNIERRDQQTELSKQSNTGEKCIQIQNWKNMKMKIKITMHKVIVEPVPRLSRSFDNWFVSQVHKHAGLPLANTSQD